MGQATMTRVFHGVPLSMQQDGWWLDTADNHPDSRQAQRKRDGIKTVLLVALIACGDMLVWNTVPALSFAILALLIVLAGMAVAWPSLGTRARIGVAAGAVFSVLPLIELVQPLSVLIALCGLSTVCATLAGLGRRDLLRGACRLWWIAPFQIGTDAANGARRLGELRSEAFDTRKIITGWALPRLRR